MLSLSLTHTFSLAKNIFIYSIDFGKREKMSSCTVRKKKKSEFGIEHGERWIWTGKTTYALRA